MKIQTINQMSLKQLGLKNTKVRQKILDILDHPVDAMELTSKLGVNKTSTYRELRVLVAKGIVKEIEFGDGKKRYELTSLGHHHHLICTMCKSISDITLESHLERAEKQIEREKSFKVVRHNLEFFGVCVGCR